MAASIPGPISCGEQVFDFVFHPNQHVIAAGLISGAVELWSYSKTEKNSRQSKFSAFGASCRGLSFCSNGEQLIAISSDRSWKVLDASNGVENQVKAAAHKSALNKLCVLNDQIFATGDDSGVVKLWDRRIGNTYSEVMSWDAHTDYITDFDHSEDGFHILSTGGDATLCVYDIRNQDHFYKSDDQESELHTVKVMRGGRKVYCGSQEGPIVIFKWGQWGDCVNRFVEHPDGVESMVKVDETTLITGSLDGSLRLVSLLPQHKIEGVIGDLNGLSVECLRLRHEDYLLASVGTDETIQFWDVSEIVDCEKSDDDDEGDDNSSNKEDSVSDSNNDQDDDEDSDPGDRLIQLEDEEESPDESENNDGNEEGGQIDREDSDEASESDNDSDESQQRPRKRIKTASEKFYADL